LVYVLKDLQIVNIALRVLHRPDARMLPSMYRQLGVDYDERVLPSICNEVIVTVTGFVRTAYTHYTTAFCIFMLRSVHLSRSFM